MIIMSFDLNYIYYKDVLDLFKDMKKEGVVVDAIINDLPYNIFRNNNFNTIRW